MSVQVQRLNIERFEDQLIFSFDRCSKCGCLLVEIPNEHGDIVCPVCDEDVDWLTAEEYEQAVEIFEAETAKARDAREAWLAEIMEPSFLEQRWWVDRFAS